MRPFEISLPARIWRYFFSLTRSMNTEEVSTDVEWGISERGLRILYYPSSKTVLLVIDIPPETFKVFEVQEPVSFWMDVERAWHALKIARGDEEVKVSWDGEDLRFSTKNAWYAFKIWEYEDKSSKLAKRLLYLQYDTEFWLKTEDLRKFLKVIEGLRGYYDLELRISPEGLRILGDPGGSVDPPGKAILEVPREDLLNFRPPQGEILLYFSPSLFSLLRKFLSREDEIQMFLGESKPLRTTFYLGDGLGQAHIFVASRQPRDPPSFLFCQQVATCCRIIYKC